jgi:hypothetical protein
MPDDHPVLLCTDGSEMAQAAIVRACEFLAPGPAEALSIWMPAPVLHPHTKPTAILEYVLLEPAENVDTANEHAAQEAARAREELTALLGRPMRDGTGGELEHAGSGRRSGIGLRLDQDATKSSASTSPWRSAPMNASVQSVIRSRSSAASERAMASHPRPRSRSKRAASLRC